MRQLCSVCRSVLSDKGCPFKCQGYKARYCVFGEWPNGGGWDTFHGEYATKDAAFEAAAYYMWQGCDTYLLDQKTNVTKGIRYRGIGHAD